MQFSRFLIVGVVATCLQYGCMWMLLTFEVCGPAIASSAGYGLSAIANYFLNYQFTFHSNRHHRSALFRFFGLVAFGLSCNAYLLVKLSDGFGLNLWLSQIMASFLVTFLNFALAKLWVYRSREES